MFDADRFAAALRDAMMVRLVTMDDVEAESTVGKTTISLVMRKKRRPSVNNYLKLCSWMGVSADEFRQS